MDSSNNEQNGDGAMCETLRVKVTKCQKQAVKEFFTTHNWGFTKVDNECNMAHVCTSTRNNAENIKSGSFIHHVTQKLFEYMPHCLDF